MGCLPRARSLEETRCASGAGTKSFQGMENCRGPLLEIETLSAEGLRYRRSIPGVSTDGWQRLEAFEVAELRDAAETETGAPQVPFTGLLSEDWAA